MRYRGSSLIPKTLPGLVRYQPDHPDLPSHGHEGFIELALVLKGRARHRLPGGETPINAGDLLVIPVEGRHAYAATDRLDVVNLVLDPQRIIPVLADLPNLAVAIAAAPFHRVRLFGPQRLKELTDMLRHYTVKERPRVTGWQSRCHGLLLMILADLDEALTANASTDSLIHDVLARMEHTPSRRLPLSTFGIPERSLLRRFRAVTGTTPAAWHRQLRAAHAQQLQRDGYSVAAAAAATGFCGPSHMKRMLKRP